MIFKHLSIGAVLMIIGVSILSPFEEIFILIPASVYLDMPFLVPVFTIFACICLGLGIFLVGKSALMHMGVVGRVVAHHPLVVLGSVVVLCVVFYLFLS